MASCYPYPRSRPASPPQRSRSPVSRSFGQPPPTTSPSPATKFSATVFPSASPPRPPAPSPRSPRAAYAHISANAAVLVSFELLNKQPEFAAKLSKTISGPANTSEELVSDFTSDSNQWLKRLALVHFEINQGDPRRALDLLRDPTLDFGHEYFPILGEVRLKLGEYREALEAFDLALARSIRCSGFALRRCYAVMR